METLSLIGMGFGMVLTVPGLTAVVTGVLIGQIVGALPGIGPSTGMALLLPVTFGMDPALAIMMLSGILYGAMYGGSITAILINVPGDDSSVVCAIEGNKLARKGKAGHALAVAALSSFAAGVTGTIVLAFAAVALSAVALRFNAPEFFLLALLGISASASLGTGSVVKALLMGLFGLLIAMVGIDPIAGTTRLTFGFSQLLDGFDFLPVAIGVFGIAEILVSLERGGTMQPIVTRFRDTFLSAKDVAFCAMAAVRGFIVGFCMGMMPGAGSTVSSFLAYGVERKFSRRPEQFGHGALDAIATTEAANNASVTGAMTPMLTLGIPGSTGTAVLLAALILQGIRPGPTLMTDQPVLVWSLIASMFVGNVVLLILNLPMAPIFASILRIPYAYLAPGIVLFSLIGAYAVTLSFFTMGVAIAFGLIGYFMIKADLPRAPLVLALVLAPLLEESLRQSLLLSLGSPLIFVQRPFSLALLVVLLLVFLMPLVMSLRSRWKARST
ncbi:tripartite tricarboxylate transporter permease [Rhodobacterales bacterium HKCCSP123]|nr:tripartite tricarboxylate transporter permease [Rhodobacterales bacterium HKCCSP123]